eukprot:TRINITY_DN720_c0_g1_i6.p1 TRINITY_DN720_c0_g1~~TRINITY_DN720_c0_g1_i6.p1  ORF type:complete len:1022 (+),score=350.49 TRINITY_DN720_c0_g1_i6:51-3068(+)
MGNDDASVKVAVRVRPFNQREKDRNAKMIIKMEGAKTTITNPADGATKAFTFDYSYYSHEGFETQDDGLMVPANPNTKGYADQTLVFNNLGKLVLDNAFEGYNTSLFAYGQTGSGKSYSMVGYGANKGIVPMACDHLFRRVVEGQSDTQRYEVTFSMLEIYNEAIRDLLTTSNPPGGLKVRENPKVGVYVDKLTHAAVASYEDIDKRTEEGTKNRTVAATNMNATSSRAHTVITIMFSQITKQDDSGAATEKKSKINLVDLAGSERADSTGATGDRLKEGSAINQSLSALGNVISALADISMGKKKVFVPYRNSVLTRILQDALGGNSKTIMIAALSPADINYDETLSTLRYADRAKKIKNKATVNENPTDKLIRELKEENARLMALLKEGGVDTTAAAASGSEGGGPMSAEDEAKLREKIEAEMAEKLAENERMMAEMAKSWEEKLAESKAVMDAGAEEEKKIKDKKGTTPHFSNINEDPALTGAVVHFIKEGDGAVTKVGKKEGNPDIILRGLSIELEHAILTTDAEGEVSIKAGTDDSRSFVNGQPLTTEPVKLKHNDRVLFGNNHFYLFIHPKQAEVLEGSEDKAPTPDWDFVQRELAKAQGIDPDDTDVGDLSPEALEKKIVQDTLVELMPMVQEANAISVELNKGVFFELKLVSVKGKTDVTVQMTDLTTDTSWMWDRNKFINRVFLMRELYELASESGPEAAKVEKEKDPFWESTDEIYIGKCVVQLSSLGYLIETEDLFSITDHAGNSHGKLQVELLPCTAEGVSEGYEEFVEDPAELLGKPLNFLLCVKFGRGLAAKYKNGVYVKVKWYLDSEWLTTETVAGTSNPEFNFSKHISIESVNEGLLQYIAEDALAFEVYGKLEANESSTPKNVDTKKLMKMRKEGIRAVGGVSALGALAARSPSSIELFKATDDENHKHQVEKLKQKVAVEHKVATKRTEQIKNAWQIITTAVKAGEAAGAWVDDLKKILGQRLDGTGLHSENSMLNLAHLASLADEE